MCPSTRAEDYEKSTSFGVGTPIPCQRWYCEKKDNPQEVIGVRTGDKVKMSGRGIPRECDFRRDYMSVIDLG